MATPCGGAGCKARARPSARIAQRQPFPHPRLGVVLQGDIRHRRDDIRAGRKGPGRAFNAHAADGRQGQSADPRQIGRRMTPV